MRETNHFRHLDAVEYAAAYLWAAEACSQGNRAEVEERLRELNERISRLEQSGADMPRYLLAAYRGYENGLMLSEDPNAVYGLVVVLDQSPEQQEV